MFKTVALRGSQASLVWAYHTAATLTRWTVKKHIDETTQRPVWTLRASLGVPVDRFKLRQRPLRFVAPRTGCFGSWCWPVRELYVGDTTVTANLDPPEY